MEVVKEEQKNSELITRDEVKDSPFIIIGTEGKFFGVLGQYRITEEHDNKSKVRADLKRMSWNRIIQICMILIDKSKEV